MRFASAVLLCVVASNANACLWDLDTLEMERSRFPGALELIVGKFLRHSDVFYEWRIEDRQEKIAAVDAGELELSDAEVAGLYDDWAVALSKLGRDEDAIEVIDRKAERFPETGRYETHANRGTFLIHSGQLEEGIAEIDQALEINPEAHFGREKYQKLLAAYVLFRREIERRDDVSPADFKAVYSFAYFLEEHESADLKDAVDGLLGMMKFGDYKSPVLLEALGDIIWHFPHLRAEEDAKLLAARAFLRAAELTSDPDKAEALRKDAESALELQVIGDGSNRPFTVSEIEAQLAREVTEAEQWFGRIKKDEALWVEAADDPDQRFWDKYGLQDVRVGKVRMERLSERYAPKGIPRWMIAVVVGGAAATLLAIFGIVQLKKADRKSDAVFKGEPR
ncbi:hypothetical protein [Stratiformator vulcanicus]|uniref:hypothetical protein n=1 Tax=Stratiformator vulcanicus TaxID=2527980 RepID=UPI0011A56DB5|nr:hypothetical protein [Stratiformator vulcanicus]